MCSSQAGWDASGNCFLKVINSVSKSSNTDSRLVFFVTSLSVEIIASFILKFIILLTSLLPIASSIETEISAS